MRFGFVALLGLLALASTAALGAVPRRQMVQRAFLATIAVPTAAMAKDTKGTKDDKEFQNCLSRCLYECTKPPSQNTRQECYPICKKQCATSDAQLLLGQPKQ
uniref:Uncharacterized protein n=1 Tax=Phaeomonas parva TaxID=124430 RepID=A0A7S1XTU1_9STRA|mmetsp:Transcript_36712/g.114983  ORF Transcript_36712/g.114983 Transcript_36712/m.114983 type:complete len:103 (+) Transcript_36712:89-397(+)